MTKPSRSRHPCCPLRPEPPPFSQPTNQQNPLGAVLQGPTADDNGVPCQPHLARRPATRKLCAHRSVWPQASQKGSKGKAGRTVVTTAEARGVAGNRFASGLRGGARRASSVKAHELAPPLAPTSDILCLWHCSMGAMASLISAGAYPGVHPSAYNITAGKKTRWR